MKLFLVLCSWGAIGLAGCITAEMGREIPECDPDKAYIQVVPPVCRPVPARPSVGIDISNCPKARLLGTPFTNTDNRNLEYARGRCVELYPSSPCLRVFAKMAPYTYRAICGGRDAQGTQHFFDIKDRSR